ncbi:hypothetical protein AU476_25985 [Cupriavidus sp. UYMSc13B]|nr:hypothetical protein AU476_25985 [Cupriavidus sp. UYMSc13B]
MIAEARSFVTQLVEQGSLGGGWHAISADKRGTACAKPIGCNSDYIGILTDKYRTTINVPFWLRTQKAPQGQIARLAGWADISLPTSQWKVQYQRWPRQFVYHDAGPGPSLSGRLITPFASVVSNGFCCLHLAAWIAQSAPYG